MPNPQSELAQIDVVPQLDDPTAQAARDVVAAATEADGTEPISEQPRLALAAAGGPDPRVLHVVARLGAPVVGYANILTPPGGGAAAVEAVVIPAARGRGVGTALIGAALRAAGDGATVWSHGAADASGPADAVAQRLNLTVVRELLQMRRPLTDLPEYVVREGISIRSYRGSEDDESLLAINNAAFSWHPEQGGWGQGQLDERFDADWFDPAGLLIAEDEGSGEMLGFHWTKVHYPPSRETHPVIGEVYVVAVAPAAQGRGVGKLLTLAGLHYLANLRFAGARLQSVELYVEGDNTAALATYGKLGFESFRVHRSFGISTI